MVIRDEDNTDSMRAVLEVVRDRGIWHTTVCIRNQTIHQKSCTCGAQEVIDRIWAVLGPQPTEEEIDAEADRILNLKDSEVDDELRRMGEDPDKVALRMQLQIKNVCEIVSLRSALKIFAINANEWDHPEFSDGSTGLSIVYPSEGDDISIDDLRRARKAFLDAGGKFVES